MGRIALDYALGYIGLTALLIAVDFGLDALFQVTAGNAANIAVLIGAAYYTGYRYGRRTGTPPDSATSWGASLVMMLVATVISAVGFAAIVLFMGDEFITLLIDGIGQLPVGLVLAIILIALAIYVIVPRIFFPIAAKSAAKDNMDKLADRF